MSSTELLLVYFRMNDLYIFSFNTAIKLVKESQ